MCFQKWPWEMHPSQGWSKPKVKCKTGFPTQTSSVIHYSCHARQRIRPSTANLSNPTDKLFIVSVSHFCHKKDQWQNMSMFGLFHWIEQGILFLPISSVGRPVYQTQWKNLLCKTWLLQMEIHDDSKELLLISTPRRLHWFFLSSILSLVSTSHIPINDGCHQWYNYPALKSRKIPTMFEWG